MNIYRNEINLLGFQPIIQSILTKTSSAFWIKSLETNQYIYLNLAFEQIFQLSCKDIIANSLDFFCFIDTIYQPIVKANYTDIENQPNQINSHVFKIVRPDNTIRWLEEEFFLITNTDGKKYLSGIIKDITKIINQEEALYNASIYFAKFAERSEDVFWVRNADYSKPIYISPSFEKVWGRSTQEIYTYPNRWNDYLHPEDYKRLTAKIPEERNLYANPDARYYENYRIIRPDGEIRYIADCSFPIFAKDNKLIGFAGIARDTTERILYEQALKDAKEKAEQADRSKSEFLANISHDLRTPLNGIMGSSQILSMSHHLPEQEELLNNLYKASKTLAQLIDDILEFSRLEHGSLPLREESANIYTTTADIIEILKVDAASKNIELIFEAVDSKQEITLDLHRYKRLLLNLIGNAIKFSDKAQPIRIGLEETPLGTDKKIININVIDRGIGIPQDKLDIIFERFHRLDPSYANRYKGSGLGLSIVKQFVAEMSGSITVESEVGKGSTFTINIPVTCE